MAQKLIEIPKSYEGQGRFPEITDDVTLQKFKHNMQVVCTSIRDKGFDANVSTDEINDTMNVFAQICLLAAQGYCKINWDVYASKFKNSKEVKFCDVKKVFNDYYNKICKYKDEADQMIPM